jgi:hypothetical protein
VQELVSGLVYKSGELLRFRLTREKGDLPAIADAESRGDLLVELCHKAG